jgi:hypothetical protein
MITCILLIKSFKQVSKRTKELYDYLKANDKKYDYEISLSSYLDDDSWYDYECDSIKRQDYERFLIYHQWILLIYSLQKKTLQLQNHKNFSFKVSVW